jgi:Tfp pilus assembly protein PilZ
MKLKLPERRRFVRVDTPLSVDIKCGDRTEKVVTKNISPVGFRFEVKKKFDASAPIEMILRLPPDNTDILIMGKVIWQSKVSLEDRAPFDVGIDIAEIEEKNKNVFLKYLCDLLYNSKYQERT